jgi:hypothetical protein
MAALVSQEQAIRQLRLNAAALSAEELADVMFKADQASAIVVDYLKRPFLEDGQTPPVQRRGLRLVVTAPPQPLATDPTTPPEPWTETTTPTVIKAVILTLLTTLYDGRTPEDELLSEPMKAVLHRFRDPAMA